MSSLELVSPIPPMMTGTAAYMRLVARRLGAVAAAVGDVRVVTDGEAWGRDGLKGEMPHQFHGMAVISWKEVRQDPPRGTTRVYFLANNDKHSFVHKMLARQSAGAGGRVIGVLHDPSMFMAHHHMERFDDEFGIQDLIGVCRSQLGVVTEKLVRARINQWLPDVFDFGVHCMGGALVKCDELWAHSLYGANRIRFENDFSGARCRTVRVCAHPTTPDLSPMVERKRDDDDTFRIGVFGWVTPPKRVDSVLRGLALALDRMNSAMRRCVRLRIVGRRTSKSECDLEGLASQLNISDVVEFIDYPLAERFEELIAHSDLIFNLRYPSCGESSGTLASAEHSRVRVVASRYQAFREAAGVWRFISVAQPYEVWEVADAIIDAIAETAKEEPSPVAAPVSPIASIDKLLLNEIMKNKTGVL